MRERLTMKETMAEPNLADLKSLAAQPCCLPYSHPDYEPPTPDQVTCLVKAAGWSQRETAILAGVTYDPKKGSTTVRKWRAPADKADHREIPYSAWRLLLIYAGVVVAGQDVEALQRS